MSQKVAKAGIGREKGYLYFVDNQGDISRIKEGGRSPQKVAKCGIKLEDGYYYFIDAQGDVFRREESSLDEVLASSELYLKEYVVNPKASPDLLKKVHELEEKQLYEKIKAEEAEKLKIERLRQKARQELLEKEYEKIPEDERIRYILDDVKEFVWRRDMGKCVKCGCQENLEFGHIIPFSKGGSNTARNIQLLCEKCNRKKTDNI